MEEESRVDNNSSAETEPKQEGSDNKEEAQEAEILNNLPPEAKRVMEMAISMSSFSGRVPNPILSKLTEGHITKILDQNGTEENNSFRDSQSSKIYNLVYFCLIVGLVIFFVVYLADRDKSLLLNLADKALYILAGFGGGYGFKAFKDSKKTK